MELSKQVEDIIADFRGLPRTATESSKQVPVSIDKILEFVKDKYGLENSGPEQVIFEHWHAIFGNLAGRCHPLALKNGKTLVISVANQTLRSELQFRKQYLIRKIQALKNCETISEILIRA